jgi:GDP-D-mannose dehydratase
MENNRALITGIPGQDGSYLAEYLLEKNNPTPGATGGSTVIAHRP